MRGLSIERHRGNLVEVSYRPRGAGDTVYDLLGAQVRPCVFQLGAKLRDTLFPEGVESAEVFNVSEDHEGFDDHFVGWSFCVRFEEHEEEWF